MLLGDVIKNSSFLKFVQFFSDLKCISFSDIIDCACTIFLPKSKAKCGIFVAGGDILKSSGKFLKSFRPVDLHFY